MTINLKRLIVILIIVNFSLVNAQVGIGTTTPATGALLDLDDPTRGLLIPRVTIADLTTDNPVTGATIGLLVWNTSGVTGVGFHYWDGNDWIPLLGGTPSKDWALTGNTITGSEFLGTTSAQDLNIRTDNVERMKVFSTGQVSVNLPVLNSPDDTFSSSGLNAISGYSTAAAGGTGVFGNSTGVNGFGVFGSSPNGLGIFGLSDSGNGVYAFTTSGIGVQAFSNSGIGVSSFSNSGMGVVGIASAITETGVAGVNGNVFVTLFGGSGMAASGPNTGLFAYAGVGARTNANRGNAAGVFVLDTDSDPNTNGNNGTRAEAVLAGFDNASPNGLLSADDMYFGGYFSGGTSTLTPSYAYAGIKYDANNNGTNGTNYKIIGNGTNSTIIRDSSDTPRVLFSPEAPEILFEDYGVDKLVNGKAEINIDPILKDAIYVDESHPLKVFIQLEGDCNGVYVTNKSANGFTVKELKNGNSNVAFSWHIVANRADDKDSSGNITSKHVGLRFPVGPGPRKAAEMSSKKDIDLKNILVNQEALSKIKTRNTKNSEAQIEEDDKTVEVKKRENLKKTQAKQSSKKKQTAKTIKTDKTK